MFTGEINKYFFVSEIFLVCLHDIDFIGELTRCIFPIWTVEIFYIIEFLISKPKPSRIRECYIFMSRVCIYFNTFIASEKDMMVGMLCTCVVYQMITIIIRPHTCLPHRKTLSDTEYAQNNQ